MPDSPASTNPNRKLWNDRPADLWLSAFPIGNGRLGAMISGKIDHERIGLNHERYVH